MRGFILFSFWDTDDKKEELKGHNNDIPKKKRSIQGSW